MSYHGVGANGPTDYEPSYETQPAEPPRYGALQPYPWDAGVPRDWPPQGIVGPSGEYSTAGFRLPRAGMGASETENVPVDKLPSILFGALAGAGVAALLKYKAKKATWDALATGVLVGFMMYRWRWTSAVSDYWNQRVKTLESATLPTL